MGSADPLAESVPLAADRSPPTHPDLPLLARRSGAFASSEVHSKDQGHRGEAPHGGGGNISAERRPGGITEHKHRRRQGEHADGPDRSYPPDASNLGRAQFIRRSRHGERLAQRLPAR